MKKLLLALTFGLISTAALAAGETVVNWGLKAGSEPRVLCIYSNGAGHPCLAAGLLNSTNNSFATGQSTRYRYWSGDVDGFPLPTTNFRIRERVFIGAAVGLPDTRATTGTWLNGTSGPSYLQRDAQLAVMSDNGGPAIVGMTQIASHTGLASEPAAIGVAGFAYDNGTVNTESFAFYGEVFAASTNANATSVIAEYDVRNASAFDSVGDPYSFGGQAAGIVMNAGGDTSYGPAITNPSNFGLRFSGFNSTWHTGIIFSNGALETNGTGYSNAIEFAFKQSLVWFTPARAQGFVITSSVGAGETPWTIDAGNAAMVFYGASAAVEFEIVQAPSAVNFMRSLSAATGNPPSMAAAGSDTDIDFQILPQGAGLLRFGLANSFSANASVATVLGSVGPVGSHTTVQKWLAVKDSVGTTLYIPAF